MKPAPFDYHAPETVPEAVALLAEHGDEAKVLAGGQSLLPMLALRLTRFEHLVDVTRVPEMHGVTRANGHLRVGAATPQAVAEHDADLAAAVPLLARALPHIGHFQIRNRGTVGGSLAHADPASELPAVALALDATFEAVGPQGAREIPAADFFWGTWSTTLADDEILVGTRFPVWSGRCGFSVAEVARRSGDFALAGVAAAVGLGDGGTLDRVAVGIFGVGSTPLRAAATEAALLGQTPDDTVLADAARAGAAELDTVDDVHATAAYRSRVAAHLMQTALGAAIEEARSV
ncbi:MAG: FAD binding domain-containing protein [Actinomycetota bacterium]